MHSAHSCAAPSQANIQLGESENLVQGRAGDRDWFGMALEGVMVELRRQGRAGQGRLKFSWWGRIVNRGHQTRENGGSNLRMPQNNTRCFAAKVDIFE